MRSYDSAPRTPHPPLSRRQVVSLHQSFCVSPVEITDERVGREAKSNTAARKPGPLEIIQYPLNRNFCFSLALASAFLGVNKSISCSDWPVLKTFRLSLADQNYLSLTLWLVFFNVLVACYLETLLPPNPCWVLRSVLLSLWHFLNGQNSIVSALIGQYYYLVDENYISF